MRRSSYSHTNNMWNMHEEREKFASSVKHNIVYKTHVKCQLGNREWHLRIPFKSQISRCVWICVSDICQTLFQNQNSSAGLYLKFRQHNSLNGEVHSSMPTSKRVGETHCATAAACRIKNRFRKINPFKQFATCRDRKGSMKEYICNTRQGIC